MPLESRAASPASGWSPTTSASPTSGTRRGRGRRRDTTTGSRRRAYVVVGGSGRIKLDDEIHELRQWGVVRMSPSVIRAVEAGENGLEPIAIGSDRPEGGDGVQVPVDWTE
jgi:hypothetical protein